MEFRLIHHGSTEYEQMKKLRMEVLLQPIGIPESYIDVEKEKNDMLVGAFQDEQLIGCCILTRKYKETVQLRQMAVHHHLQGKGIGALILTFAEKKAAGAGFTTMMMHARAAVCPFYAKCGYRKTGPEFHEVGIAHYAMEKRLV